MVSIWSAGRQSSCDFIIPQHAISTYSQWKWGMCLSLVCSSMLSDVVPLSSNEFCSNKFKLLPLVDIVTYWLDVAYCYRCSSMSVSLSVCLLDMQKWLNWSWYSFGCGLKLGPRLLDGVEIPSWEWVLLKGTTLGFPCIMSNNNWILLVKV